MAKKKKQQNREEIRWAWTIIRQYCAVAEDIAAAKTDLWEMLKASLTCQEDYYSASDRSDFIYTYELLLKLLDALQVLEKHYPKT